MDQLTVLVLEIKYSRYVGQFRWSLLPSGSSQLHTVGGARMTDVLLSIVRIRTPLNRPCWNELNQTTVPTYLRTYPFCVSLQDVCTVQ